MIVFQYTTKKNLHTQHRQTPLQWTPAHILFNLENLSFAIILDLALDFPPLQIQSSVTFK